MDSFTLSRKEMELMEILWDAGVPLSRGEILARAEQRQVSWKPNSVHVILNALLDKGAVVVAGYYVNSRKLGRNFTANITRRQYAMMQVELNIDRAGELAGLDRKTVLRELSRKQKEEERA